MVLKFKNYKYFDLQVIDELLSKAQTRMEDTLDYDYVFKYILVGDASVGKSTLLQFYINRNFNDSNNPTMGVQFATKKLKIKDKIIKLQIWDTAGQQSFRTITRAYYKNAIGIILMYDLNAPSTFKSVKSWFDEIEDNSNSKAEIVVVGNKTDLVKENVNQYCGEHQFLVTSAKTGQNVDNLFRDLTQKVLQKIQKGQIPTDGTVGVKKGNVGSNSKLKSSSFVQPIHHKPKKSCC